MTVNMLAGVHEAGNPADTVARFPGARLGRDFIAGKGPDKTLPVLRAVRGGRGAGEYRHGRPGRCRPDGGVRPVRPSGPPGDHHVTTGPAPSRSNRAVSVVAMTEPELPQQRMNLSATPEMESGAYADFVSIWHTPDIFTLDFGTMTRPAQLVPDENGQPVVDLAARLVARVRIPPKQVFELMKALEQQLSAWERETGQGTPGSTI